MNVYVMAIGCKLNRSEVEELGRQFSNLGHRLVEDPAEAHWALVNTCTVTHVAARKCRQALRALSRANPQLRLAVTGCYAEMAREEVSALPGVALVLDNEEKDQLIARILKLEGLPTDRQVSGTETVRPLSGRTRALVKIQDGCDNTCTYCIVRVARGSQRSRVPEEVLAEVRDRLAQGYREVVLTGVHIGAYGRDGHPQGPLPPEAGWSLERLVRAILEETAPPRLRLSSIEPWDVTPGLLALFGDRRLCRHLHLPIQSGSDTVLRRMGRSYGATDLAALVSRVREAIPGVALTTDVIVGFPGETEEDFRATMAFVRRAAFARLHVFRFSPRPGTLAAELDGQVPSAVAEARSKSLRADGRALALASHASLIGEDVEVLFEHGAREDGERVWGGLTDRYVRVWVRDEGDLSNALRVVRVTEADAQGARGVLLPAGGSARLGRGERSA